MFKLTPVVRNLVIINVIVYALQIFVEGVTGKLELWGPNAVHVYADAEPFRPYQLFTYMFAHNPKSFFHIFFNMLVLATTGPILENFWGQKKFLIFYMVTGIGAGIFHLAVETFVLHSPGIPMLGASGAIYGVLMAFGMMFPNMEVMLLLPPIPIKAKYLVWVLGIMTYLLSGANVAHFAHLGGIVFAFILLRIWRSQDGSYF
jgi:membrane associated rhomboid family serine protease